MTEEVILKTKMGDYWSGSLVPKQITGSYTFIDQRIQFKGGMGMTVFDLPYVDITSAKLCNVGGFIRIIPTGILITMKDGKTHRLSIMKRKEFLALIESKL